MIKYIIIGAVGILLLTVFKRLGSIILSVAASAVILYAAYNITMDTLQKVHYVTPVGSILH